MKFLAIIFILFAFNMNLNSQTIQQEKMQLLSYMVGDWIGTSTSYLAEGAKSEVEAFESIRYKLDSSIITIDLHSATLQLHTVIYYDEKAETYFYNPFYKAGAAKYPAAFSDGKFVVTASNEKRFVFPNLVLHSNYSCCYECRQDDCSVEK